MELEQLRCFVAVAEELHFGKAAQKTGMLPASLGRHVRLLEESLGTKLLSRTTRSVDLTDDGVMLLREVKPLFGRLETVANRFRTSRPHQTNVLRIGAIDSAAAGLVPQLLHDFRERSPETSTQLMEDKSIRLIPKLLAGRLDLVLIRPREKLSRNLSIKRLFSESVVVAVPVHSPMAQQGEISIGDLADEPLIVPERRSRPHSHDLTFGMFAEAGLRPCIAQVADEKQTIINLVAAGIGSALVPRWTSKLVLDGVKYIPLRVTEKGRPDRLPLAVAWVKAVRDPRRDQMLEVLEDNLERYAANA
ncbi:LysR family transcriptional regulator [Agrobacterium larrymoorei]|uniref:HTH-type transcriptional regulator TtuA n=1 Tax=Agrobacterium larrymoorei TaxID=160699 RepID=A0A4D7DVH0_9HYPH|nr:LysR substrate-binding domain-containing protein [Agrobacterium larrymoorei]QCJ01074.1 LysR family transcriptional regulator [Agrobacterium larrymoorei]QYA10091.1 LysR family transcriptional regulator [Agrobacterium larrymoorei]